MKNILDIRYEKKMYYILSQKSLEDTWYKGDLEKVAIFVNLFYEDSVEFYLKYLKQLDGKIKIYITSSNKKILQRICKIKSERTNFYVIDKENRGRDISALLVACREQIKRNEYICFLHDKMWKIEYLRKDVEVLIRNLWENMVASDIYVKNILGIFEKNTNIGLLVPPEPIGEYFWYGDGTMWYDDFLNTLSLKEKFSLKCDIVKEKSPITFGSVFWGRTEALKKLLDYKWKYTDFLDEPLPDDGTISHAIERVFGYVAQDAGYDTGTVMTSDYASVEIAFLQENLRKACSLLTEEYGIKNFFELKNNKNKRKKIIDFFNENEKVYLYGAGERAIDCLKYIKNCGYVPDGFVVSSKSNIDMIDRIKVIELSELEKSDSIGVIVAVGYKLQDEIIDILEKIDIKNYITFLD